MHERAAITTFATQLTTNFINTPFIPRSSLSTPAPLESFYCTEHAHQTCITSIYRIYYHCANHSCVFNSFCTPQYAAIRMKKMAILLMVLFAATAYAIHSEELDVQTDEVDRGHAQTMFFFFLVLYSGRGSMEVQ